MNRDLQKLLCSICVPFCAVFLLCGCATEKKSDTVKKTIPVGSTYDEVEKLLGKPQMISRGVSMLNFGVEELTREELLSAVANPSNNIELDVINGGIQMLTTAKEIAEKAISDNAYEARFWPGRKTVITQGELIYVTWAYYSDTKTDTATVLTNFFTVRCDTSMSSSVPYDYQIDATIHDISITFDHTFHFDKKTYEKISDRFWFTDREEEILTEKEYRNGNYRGNIHGPATVNARRIVTRPSKMQITRKAIPISSKQMYATTNVYCVVFDASSGRVVMSGYQPMFVTKIN